MKKTVIHNLPDWRVTSWGNGLAYEIANMRTSQSVYFQGDDALEFSDRLELLTESRTGPRFSFADALGCLWSDYSELATDGITD
jgi:hypothetical protein